MSLTDDRADDLRERERAEREQYEIERDVDEYHARIQQLRAEREALR